MMEATTTLGLCMIVKYDSDEITHALKAIHSVGDAVDDVYITLTYTGKKPKKVKRLDKYNVSFFEWVNDFSAARNFNFAQAKTDWIVWMDADDVIENAEQLKKDILRAEPDGINSIMYPYHYVIDEHGNTKCLQMRERSVRGDGTYKWVGWVHEAMLPMNDSARAIRLPTVTWKHITNPKRVERSTERNVEMLELALETEIKEDKVDARTVYNLGNAYFTIDEHQKALACYQKYIGLSGWDAEKFLAENRSALCLMHLGNKQTAAQHALLALEIKPEWPDARITLGKIYFEQQMYSKALYWFLDARKQEFPEGNPVVNPMDYTANINWLAGHCYVQLQEYKKAIPEFKQFLNFFPDNQDAIEILKVLSDGLKTEQEVGSLIAASKILGGCMPWGEVPKKYLEFPELLVEKNKYNIKATSGGKDIAIYCGKSPGKWDPSSEREGGVGGSEEAVINLARLLAQKGWNVTVFGRPLKEGVYDGATYAHFTEFNPKSKYDVFISWRMPSVFSRKINATKKYLWLHDVVKPEQFGPHNLPHIDKVMVLSKFHRELIPNVPDEKIMLTGNGINPEQFTYEVEKNPNYCIYTSSADRGLECLLKMWPRIREKAPQAELHWFYGWQTFDKLHQGDKEKMAWKGYMQSLLSQPGVFDEGRVDHYTIANKYKEAQLWLYPTEFSEIYCITADKAQAGGALPVTTRVAALDERVQYGTKFDVKNIYSNKEAQEKYIEQTIEYLLNPEIVDVEREGMVEQTLKNCTWQRIADQWDKELS